MEESRKMTAIEAVQATQNLLGEIVLPVRYRGQIGILHSAMNNLEAIARMIEEELEEAKHAENHNEERDA